jgi:SAM-dependent methyltransferase
VGDFSPEWLALREPADHAARSPRLTRLVADAIGGDQPRRIVDLGSGTGSNLRYLAPRLPRPQHWLLVDRDPELLAISGTSPVDDVSIESRNVELAAAGGPALDQLLRGAALVTASALLDLVSESWLDAIADICREARAALLFALTYDGRIDCDPGEQHDALVRALLNEHQRGNKGFGPALGPSAVDRAVAALAARGYSTARERSDWILVPHDCELQRQLVDGWAGAALEIASAAEATAIEAWRGRRRAHIDADRSRMIVGHQDLAALPT